MANGNPMANEKAPMANEAPKEIAAPKDVDRKRGVERIGSVPKGSLDATATVLRKGGPKEDRLPTDGVRTARLPATATVKGVGLRSFRDSLSCSTAITTGASAATNS